MGKEAKSAAPLIVSSTAILLPVLYVLSTGPLRWLAMQGIIQEPVTRWLNAFYRPISWIAERSPICEASLHWYLRLWEPT